MWVVHDVWPNAISSKVKGYVHPKSWYVDFSPVTVELTRFALRPADIEAGADDDGGADPAQEIGEVAEEEVADATEPRSCMYWNGETILAGA